MNSNKSYIKKIAITGVITALSFILVTINFPIFPQASFLRFDFADIPILVLSFAFGPLYGIISTVIVSIFQCLFLSSDGIFGGVMHILSTGVLVLTASLIYYRAKSKKSAVIGLALGCVAMTVSMVVFNYLLDPYFYGMPQQQIIPLLPWVGAFNLIKSVVNSTITFLIYKLVKPILKVD